MGNLTGRTLLFSKYHSTLNLSIALTISAAFWGLFWIFLAFVRFYEYFWPKVFEKSLHSKSQDFIFFFVSHKN